jgi:LmbE family N-acetylglucosaminyl deacetylase
MTHNGDSVAKLSKLFRTLPSKLRRRLLGGGSNVALRLQPTFSLNQVRGQLLNLRVVDSSTIYAQSPILVLAPHPDDETLGCGGLIAEACAAQIHVWVFILTDGAGSHPRSISHPPKRLKLIRQEETRRALSILGLPSERVVFLDYSDGAAPAGRTQLRDAVQRLSALARDRGIKTICATWKHDPHPDHKATYRIARLTAANIGARLLCYPIWLWSLPDKTRLPASHITGYRVDISKHLESKKAAIACHVSQTTRLITDDPQHVPLSEAFLQSFKQRYEVLIES